MHFFSLSLVYRFGACSNSEIPRLPVVANALTEYSCSTESFSISSVASPASQQNRKSTKSGPRTGEPVQVERKHVPFFKAGKLLRDRLNGLELEQDPT